MIKGGLSRKLRLLYLFFFFFFTSATLDDSVDVQLTQVRWKNDTDFTVHRRSLNVDLYVREYSVNEAYGRAKIYG